MEEHPKMLEVPEWTMTQGRNYSWKGMMSHDSDELYQCQGNESNAEALPSSVDLKKDPPDHRKTVVLTAGPTPPYTIDRRAQQPRGRLLPKVPAPTTAARSWGSRKEDW